MGALLWPVFSAGEPGLLVVLVAFLVVGAGIAAFALRSGSSRTVRYALLGVLPGFILGGLTVGLIARFAGAGAGGWEDLVAVVLAILGSFVGAVVGIVVGGIIGWRAERRAAGR